MHSDSRKGYLLTVVAVGVVVVLAGTSLAQSGNSSLGTWKLRGPLPSLGAGSPTGVILTYEAAGTGVKATLDVMGANGLIARLEFSARYDGQDNPVTGSGQVGDVVALTRLDVNTVRLVHKRDGKVILTETAVVSSDGKTMTITNTDAQGNPVEGVAVWDKLAGDQRKANAAFLEGVGRMLPAERLAEAQKRASEWTAAFEKRKK